MLRIAENPRFLDFSPARDCWGKGGEVKISVFRSYFFPGVGGGSEGEGTIKLGRRQKCRKLTKFVQILHEAK